MKPLAAASLVVLASLVPVSFAASSTALAIQTSADESVPADNKLVSKTLDDGSLLITRGFPYRHDLVPSQDDTKDVVEIEKVSDKGVFYGGKNSRAMIAVRTKEGRLLFLGTKGGVLFQPTCALGVKAEPAAEGFIPICDAVGSTWLFLEPGISFSVGEHWRDSERTNAYLFTSKEKGASIEFRKDGVRVKGFEIKEVRRAKQPGATDEAAKEDRKTNRQEDE